MKRAYYYFLFRLFEYYKQKEPDIPLFVTTVTSTVVLFFNLYPIYALAGYFELVPMIENKYWVIPIMAVIAFFNYYFFIRKKEFLNYGFTKNKKGTWGITVYIFITAVIAIGTAQFNREKIFAEHRANPPTEEVVRQNSLEQQIRDWWSNRRI